MSARGTPGLTGQDGALSASGLRLARRGRGAPRPTRALLEDVSLALRPGEVVGLIGPNGAGKSTLLRLLAGLEPPDAGTVHLLGRPIGTWSPRDRTAHLAHLPQHFAPHWDWRVSEMLRLGAERAAASPPLPVLAAAFGLEALLDRRWSALSGGERARTLAVMVLAPDPPVILADEPEASLDIGQGAALMAHLTRRARSGAAVLVALHDLGLAARWCDRLILLAEGRLRLEGPTRAVLTSPALDAAYGTPLERVTTADGGLLIAADPAARPSHADGAR